MEIDHEVKLAIEQLADRSERGELEWRSHNDRLFIDVGNNSFAVKKTTDDSNRINLTFSFHAAGGKELWSLVQTETNEHYALLQRLYDAALRAIVKKVLSELTILSEGAPRSPSSIIMPTSPGLISTTPLPPLASTPTPAQIAHVFQNMAGEWLLDYTKAKEKARISPSGEYYVDAEKKYEGMPKFRLVLIACNEELTRIEIAKDFVDTKRRLHIEVLDVKPNAMEGFVNTNQRQLKYLRTGKWRESQSSSS